jgi:hypothetical protein
LDFRRQDAVQEEQYNQTQFWEAYTRIPFTVESPSSFLHRCQSNFDAQWRSVMPENAKNPAAQNPSPETVSQEGLRGQLKWNEQRSGEAAPSNSDSTTVDDGANQMTAIAVALLPKASPEQGQYLLSILNNCQMILEPNTNLEDGVKQIRTTAVSLVPKASGEDQDRLLRIADACQRF